MGKDLHGGHHTIIQSATYMATVVALWLRLGTRGYDARAMRRLCGKIVWASRPGRGAMPFMNGALAWLNWGPAAAKYTPTAVLRGLMEAIAVRMTPWAAPAPLAGPAEQWFVDAAFDAGQWTAALWTPDRGARVWKLPLWVRTQQGAELAAIEAAIRVAAHERLYHIRLVANNMAAIWATKRTKASMANPDRARHLRRIQHLLRWSHLRVHMSWVASRFNPAASPSELDKYESAIHMMADAEATYQTLRKLPQHSPRAMGWVHYRGYPPPPLEGGASCVSYFCPGLCGPFHSMPLQHVVLRQCRPLCCGPSCLLLLAAPGRLLAFPARLSARRFLLRHLPVPHYLFVSL